MRELLTAMTTVVFVSCATNPARPLTPNTEEVQVRKTISGVDDDGKEITSHFVRGKDPLDEQEFYTVISDEKSLEAVKSSRASGSFLQGLGLTMLGVGIAVAGGLLATFFLSQTHDDGTPQTIPIAEESRQWFLYGGYGGAALAIGGGFLFFGTRNKAMGKPMIFDLDHAQASLEKSLYGENGLSPDDIKKLDLQTSTGSPTICSGSTTSVVVGAFDKMGRVIQVGTRSEWFDWSSNPKVQFSDRVSEGDEDRKTLEREIASPLRYSLATLEQDLTIKLTVVETGVNDDLVLKHDLSCPGSLSYSGPGGSYGRDGSSGQSGQDGFSSRGPGSGGTGQTGGDGADGENGARVKAEAAWVNSPTRGRLLLVVTDDGSKKQMAIVDPKTKVEIFAAGGHGGKGGDGGDGGKGGHAPGLQSCMAGGNGGSGGSGGRGGRGGAGGSVTLEISDDAIRSLVEASAPGGSGGSAGGAGRGGSYGSNGTCKKGFAPNGSNGPRGSSGSSGSSGPSGTVNVKLVGAADLDLITEALTQNPSLTLDAPVGSPAAKPKKHR